MADNKCVCCGEIIPERMIACPNCFVVSKRQATETSEQKQASKKKAKKENPWKRIDDAYDALFYGRFGDWGD